MIFGSGCPSCLGKDQGCQDGRCDIIYQLPPDVMCGGCVKSCPPGKSPSNKMTCDIVWHRKPPVDIIANAMEAWVPNLSIGRLFQNVSMSVNMFGMNMCASPCDNSPTGPVRRTEISQECVSSDHERRIRELEDKLQTLLRNHGDRVSELESSGARLKASCKTADAASQTDPEPTEEYDAPTAAADVKKDAVCDALGNNSEAEDVTVKDHTVVLQHTKPKKKRKPRKNRSRGARSRAKAAAA